MRSPGALFNTDDMAHKIPRCVEWASSIHTLEPGDILATGTNHRGLNSFMDGDVITLEVQGLGKLDLRLAARRIDYAPFSGHKLYGPSGVGVLYGKEIERVNRKFARVEQVKKFFLLETQLTAEDEELTPTMKLKRKLVQQKYASQIDLMYQA